MRLAAFAAALLLSSAASAQPAPVEIKAEVLAPGIAVLVGQGGNIGVSWGEDGTVLIDDQFAPLTPKIQAAVAGLGAAPVKFLINTHWHGDHTGGNENFGKAGALIMAHDNVRVRMATEQRRGERVTPPSPKVALPVVTYHDGLSLHLNGDTVRTRHMHDGHTDGDSIVVWEKANIVHMGDLFFHKVTLPFIDLSSGGSAKGLLAAIEATLALTDANTKFIPGHGPMATRADLIAYRDMLRSLIDKVGEGIAAKKTLAEVQAMKPAAAWDTNPQAFIKGDAFVEAIYTSLKSGPKAHKHGKAEAHTH
jgi:glyoxylase-like metal-dependent hydrolase (beta-lactamase superfamily II)